MHKKKYEMKAYLNAAALVSRVKRKIKYLIPSNSVIIVAFSGGPDSTALLKIISDCAFENKFTVIACHFNHKLRGVESDRDEKFCRKYCGKNKIKFISGCKDVKKTAEKNGFGVEMAARETRYNFLIKRALKEKAGFIVLGHNMNDLAETYLMRLIKGAGIEGLSGISEKRLVGGSEFGGAAKGKNIFFVRPLLGETKKDILNYLKLNRIDYVTDKTNDSNKYERNRIRSMLIPFIEKNFNPSFVVSCAKQAELLAADSEFIGNITERFISETMKSVDGEKIFDAEKLKNAHPAIRGRVIRQALIEFIGPRKSGKNLVNLVTDALLQGKNADITQDLYVYHLKNKFIVTNKNKKNKKKSKKPVELIIGGEAVKFNGVTFWAKLVVKFKKMDFSDKNIACLDYDKITKKLFLRSKKSGDEFIPYGMKKTVKLKDFFIKQKIKNKELPVVTDEDKILWIPGIRIDERVKITDNTKKILVIKAVF